MDVAPQEGGARSTRRRKGRGRRTRTADAMQEGGADVGVEKADAPVPVPALAAAPVGKELAPVNAPTTMQMVGGAATQKVVIAPPKKKPAKLMLVPKHKTVSAASVKKTFKAKRVRVVIDNTAKTQKRRRLVLGRIDGLTEVQLREAAVTAKLARAETVKKVPVDLLRQMLRDYQTLRGNLL